MNDKEVSTGGYSAYTHGPCYDLNRFHNGPDCICGYLAGDPPYIFCHTCKVVASVEAVGERIWSLDSCRPASHSPTPTEGSQNRIVAPHKPHPGRLPALGGEP